MFERIQGYCAPSSRGTYVPIQQNGYSDMGTCLSTCQECGSAMEAISRGSTYVVLQCISCGYHERRNV